MDFEKVRCLTVSLKSELGETYGSFGKNSITFAKLINLLGAASQVLPDNKTFFETISKNIFERMHYSYFGISPEEARQICNYILELISLEEGLAKKVKDKKIFQGAKDKLEEAGKSFRRDDPTSVMNNLNSCLELALKERLDIPTTIPNIHTAKIIDICIKYKIGPIEYLKEVNKHVRPIDNTVKHQGYSPSKEDCIYALNAVESLISKLDKEKITLTNEMKQKIYSEV